MTPAPVCVKCGVPGGTDQSGIRPKHRSCRACERASRRPQDRRKARPAPVYAQEPQDAREAEIDHIRRRIAELEAKQSKPAPAPLSFAVRASRTPAVLSSRAPRSPIAPAILDTKWWVVTSDEHTELHDDRAVNIVCDVIRDTHPYGLVHNGDLLDMHPISHWREGSVADQEGRRLIKMFRPCNDVLDRYRAAAGPRLVEWHHTEGNHEEWWAKWFRSGGNIAFEGLPGMTYQEQLHFERRGIISHAPYGKKTARVKVGDLLIFHGKNVTMYAPARELAKYKCNLLFGNTHTMGLFCSESADDPIIAWNLGFLGDQNADVFHYRDDPSRWVQSFALAGERRSGKTSVQPIVIRDGQAEFAAKVYGCAA